MLVALLLSTSCVDNNILTEEKGYYTQEGRIHFNQMGDFGALIDDLDKLEGEEFENLRESFQIAFLDQAESNLVKNDVLRKNGVKRNKTEVSGESEIVEDPLLASVLNEHGIMQIDTTVYRFTYDYLFRTGISNMALLLDDNYLYELVSSKTSKLQNLNNQIIYDPIDHNADFPEFNADGDPPLYGSSTTKMYTTNPGRRLYGNSWNTTSPVYSSFGSKTVNQKRNPMGWWSAPVEYLLVSASARFKTNIGTVDSTRNKFVEDYARVINPRLVKLIMDKTTGWKQYEVDWLMATHIINSSSLPSGESVIDYTSF